MDCTSCVCHRHTRICGQHMRHTEMDTSYNDVADNNLETGQEAVLGIILFGWVWAPCFGHWQSLYCCHSSACHSVHAYARLVVLVCALCQTTLVMPPKCANMLCTLQRGPCACHQTTGFIWFVGTSSEEVDVCRHSCVWFIGTIVNNIMCAAHTSACTAGTLPPQCCTGLDPSVGALSAADQLTAVCQIGLNCKWQFWRGASMHAHTHGGGSLLHAYAT